MRTASSLSSWGTRAPPLACILGARSGPPADAGYRVGGIGDDDRARRGGTAEQAAELWPPLYCGAAMPAYGCCANPLHPLVLGPAPSFPRRRGLAQHPRSEEHTSELQSPCNLVCRLLLEKKKNIVVS